jgi:hypothetical protein
MTTNFPNSAEVTVYSAADLKPIRLVGKRLKQKKTEAASTSKRAGTAPSFYERVQAARAELAAAGWL